MHWAPIAAICLVLAGCGFEDRIEGCGTTADALAVEGLKPTGGGRYELAGKALPLPSEYLYRDRDGALELFAKPGVFCDSGDWGLYRAGFVKLQLHKDAAPEDPFIHFPNTHRGHARPQQIDLGVGPFVYTFDQNALTWRVVAYFADPYRPRAIFMYVTSEVVLDGRRYGVAIHHFPAPAERVLAQLTASIEGVTHRK